MILPRTELVEYSTASMLAETYQREMKSMREHYIALGESTARLRAAFMANGGYNYDFTLSIEHHSRSHSLDGEGFDRIEKAMHRDSWACLIRKLDVRKIMSKAKQEMLDAQLEGKGEFYDCKLGESVPLGPLPEITAENIIAVLSDLVENSGSMIEEKIAEEYDFWKSHRMDGYKTNDPNILGERVIRGWLVERYPYQGRNWDTKYNQQPHLQALDHIFHLLDGKGIPQEYDGALVTAIKSCGRDGKGETEYFAFKCFKNGNLHLRFKRLDLLAEFNRIAGGQNIGQHRAKSRGTTAV